MKEEFLKELEAKLAGTRKLERSYRYMQLGLMVLITSCGFLTAASTNEITKNLWVSNPLAVLLFGLSSALAAIINQVLTPAEKYLFHKQVKKALRNIRGAVKYGDMPVAVAERLRAQATVDPASVLPQIYNNAGGEKNG